MRIQRLIIGLVLVGKLASCDDDLNIHWFKDDSSITTLNGTWKVLSYEDYITNRVEVKTEENSRGLDTIVTFDDTKDPNELSGTNTTNTARGEFEYIETRTFRLSSYTPTEVAQPEWANKFDEAITDGELEFKINSTGLRIYYDSNNKSVTLTRE